MDNIKIIIMSFFHISFWLKSISIYYYILCSKVEDIILFLISSVWLTADLRLMTSVCYLLASWSRQYNSCTNLTLSFCYKGEGNTVASPMTIRLKISSQNIDMIDTQNKLKCKLWYVCIYLSNTGAGYSKLEKSYAVVIWRPN